MTYTSPFLTSPDDALLTGWGRTSPSLAKLTSVTATEDIEHVIGAHTERGVLARGLGRSYGDAAQSGGAHVLDMTKLNGFTLDRESATVTAEAGASLDAILRAIVPQGFFVAVTPGTRMVTVGGAIAADVHGKSHHHDGTFGSNVLSLDIIDGTGVGVRTLTPDDPRTREDFWATVGGMGLTGVITRATFRVTPIETALVSVDTERANDLDDAMARMVKHDDDYRYSAAWIDTVSASGRGVLTRGDHAPLSALSAKQRRDPLSYGPAVRLSAPNFFPGGALNPLTIKAFNEAWFRKAPKHAVGELHSIPSFFHPLDGVQEWNRVYGPNGFLQYQFVVPDSASHLIRTALDALRASGAPSFLTVLKRFGQANVAPLSFPQPGWTLAADVPAGLPGLGAVLDQLDEQVADAGGRLYFAKDSRQSPQMVRRTYPRLSEWQIIRKRMDPTGMFTSDLARRLQL